MNGPLEQRDGKLRIYLKDDYRRVGRAFTTWGLGLDVPFGIVALIRYIAALPEPSFGPYR